MPIKKVLDNDNDNDNDSDNDKDNVKTVAYRLKLLIAVDLCKIHYQILSIIYLRLIIT